MLTSLSTEDLIPVDHPIRKVGRRGRGAGRARRHVRRDVRGGWPAQRATRDVAVASPPTVRIGFLSRRRRIHGLSLDITWMGCACNDTRDIQGLDVMSAPEAAQRAGITYRQLDHWDRQRWVKASRVEEVSARRRVRRYSPLDVARLATLRHLAACRFDLAVHGPAVGALPLQPDVLVVAGGDPETIRLVERDAIAEAVTAPGRWSVFDPSSLLRQDPELSAAVTLPRRSA
jgi:DNA-binding transcriptional MerR regulator